MVDVVIVLFVLGAGLGLLLKKAAANPELAEKAAKGLWNLRK